MGARAVVARPLLDRSRATMLDTFFRRYAWTATLALLATVAWVLARTVNIVVGEAIRPPPEAALDGGSTAPRAAAVAALDVDRLYRLLGIDPPAPAAGAPVPGAEGWTPGGGGGGGGGGARGAACGDPAARPARSSLALQLVATALVDPPAGSLATFLDPTSHETSVVGVGERFGGTVLLAVVRIRDGRDPTGNAFRSVAVICNGGAKEYIDDAAGAVSPELPANLGVAPVPAGGAYDGIRKVGDNRYSIERRVVDGALSNLSTLATQARLVPNFKNGVANGFKLFQIAPGSLYAAIGVQNGDVITQINGYDINSPDKALEIYQKLRESSHISIVLDRGGQVLKTDYDIGGP